MNFNRITIASIQFIFFFSIACQNIESQAYKIDIKIQGANNLESELGYYLGDKQFVVQKTKFDEKGRISFEGKEKLLSGIYFIVVGNKGFFDLLIRNEQQFSVHSDTVDIINEMKIKGSAENEIFYSYQKKVFKIKRQMAVIESRAKQLEKDNDSIQIYENEQKGLEKELHQLASETQKQNPDSYLAKILNAMNLPNEDQFDYSDEELLRTPFFHNMVRLFIKKNIEKNSGYIKYQTSQLLDSLKLPAANYQYIATYLLNFYNSFYKVGIDEVFVYIADNYFLPDKAKWLNDKMLVQIKERRDFLSQSLPGQPAQDLTMESTTGEFYSLQQVNSNFILLYFWSADCGHCSESSKILKENYEALLKKNIQIFSVNVDKDREKWLKKIEEMATPWLNCYDPDENSKYRDKYYVYGTPLLYLIDSKKMIVTKKKWRGRDWQTP